jgi:hypothetical protein
MRFLFITLVPFLLLSIVCNAGPTTTTPRRSRFAALKNSVKNLSDKAKVFAVSNYMKVNGKIIDTKNALTRKTKKTNTDPPPSYTDAMKNQGKKDADDLPPSYGEATRNHA